MEIQQRPFPLKRAASLSGRRETKRIRIVIRRREPEKIEIPNDHVLEEILLRLPPTSLVRFQKVSKHWRSLIRSRYFGERYASHQKRIDPKLLLVCDDFVNGPKKNVLFLKSMTLDTMSPCVEDRQFLKYEGFKGFLEISESCDGLVCIYGLTKAVKVINPATKMFLQLPLANIQQLLIEYPKPRIHYWSPVPIPFQSFTRLGFGKDNSTGRYKLVWLYNKYPATSPSSIMCEVLDFEEKKWRFVDTTTLDHHHLLYNQRPAFANGSFYWLTGDEGGNAITQTELVVFDIHTEMFRVTATPPFVTRDAFGNRIGVCNLHGRLCVSQLKADCKQEFWWRVKDDTWEKLFSVDLRSTSTWFRGITSQPLTPLAISRDDNKVILSLTYQKGLVAFDLNPHSSTVYHLYHSGYYGLAVPYFPSFY